jgi:outer membrane protein insertion porin family
LIPDDLGMSGAVFADAGSLFGAGALVKSIFASPNGNSCGQPLMINPATGAVANTGICLADSAAIRASVGFGILWNSPLGPLRLDIAKAILKESYDKEQLIRFGASTRF